MDMQGSGYRAAEATAAQHVRLAGGGAVAPVTPVATHHRDELLVGEVMDISGSASRILLDAATLHKLAASTDPAIAIAGQVGAQIRVGVSLVWLLASIRDQQWSARGTGLIVALVDFLGHGDEEKLIARIHNFR